MPHWPVCACPNRSESQMASIRSAGTVAGTRSQACDAFTSLAAEELASARNAAKPDRKQRILPSVLSTNGLSIEETPRLFAVASNAFRPRPAAPPPRRAAETTAPGCETTAPDRVARGSATTVRVATAEPVRRLPRQPRSAFRQGRRGPSARPDRRSRETRETRSPPNRGRVRATPACRPSLC